MRSATSKTSTRLWLITTTPRLALAQARIRSRHLGRLGDAERRGRLVEQHDLRLAEQRAGDRDLLALAAGERADLAAQARDRHRQVREQLAGLVLHPRLVELARDGAGAGRDLLAAEEEVGDDVEVVAEREVLVDGRDPERGRVLGLGDRDLLAAEADRAGVGGVDAGDRLDHRRLAGAVVADEADHLAGVDGEVDPVQCLDRAESLADSLQLEERSAVGHLSPRCPLLCTPARRRSVHSSGAVTKPSAITVLLTLSLVTATGSSTTDGHLARAVVEFFGDFVLRDFFAFGEGDRDFGAILACGVIAL